MKFQFHLKNGETHEFTLPDAAEIHRAIMWVPRNSDDKKKEAANFIIIPDDVETVDVFDETEHVCATLVKNARDIPTTESGQIVKQQVSTRDFEGRPSHDIHPTKKKKNRKKEKAAAYSARVRSTS